MGIKTTLRRLARGIDRLPGVSRALRMPAVRSLLATLPGGHNLIAGSARIGSWKLVHPFDVEHGTDTSGFVSVDDLDQLEHEAVRVHARPYAGSQPSIVRTALTTLLPLDSFTFVDLGCGKGRPLLVASEFSFREIVGVELSAPLATIARHNAELIKRRFPRRPPIKIVLGDAARFQLPAGNLVLFLYNPFDDAAIGDLVDTVNAALTTAPRTIYVVYYNPVVGHRFDASPTLQRYFAATLPYAINELGYGPDAEDPIVIWQGGIARDSIGGAADARIEVIDPQYRAKLAPSSRLAAPTGADSIRSERVNAAPFGC